ncbi:MAG: hypothetical protein HYW23_03515 [Candidatus Aenigmarchaeota archaeon]|nr:hypothetical protein [Candidatus Aenigmarchaeota archaeon]
MILGVFSYLFTIIVFAGIAILIEWKLFPAILKKYAKIIGIVLIVGIISTLIGEPIALQLGIWSYSSEKTFGIYVFGAELETLIYAMFVFVAIASATIIGSQYEDARKLTVREFKSKIGIFH